MAEVAGEGEGHEKGGAESDVGFAQCNFLTPVLQVNTYEELNFLLHKACLQNVRRHVRGKEAPVEELWEEEKVRSFVESSYPRPLPVLRRSSVPARRRGHQLEGRALHALCSLPDVRGHRRTGKVG